MACEENQTREERTGASEWKLMRSTPGQRKWNWEEGARMTDKRIGRWRGVERVGEDGAQTARAHTGERKRAAALLGRCQVSLLSLPFPINLY